MEELVKNKSKIQVLTDSGWSDFDGVSVKGIKETLKLRLERTSIELTPDHLVFDVNGYPWPAQALKPGMKIKTKAGYQLVVSICTNGKKPVYDLVNVKKKNRFLANELLISNCEFIIFDETLINSLKLVEMEGVDPIERQGQVRWYSKPKKGNIYLVGLDPSLGTGGDYAAIQVLEVPSLKQVAEWHHNGTPIQKQVGLLKEICGYLYTITESENDIYYSVENNTLGEAALVTISELGEENIRGVFLSEPKNAGSGRRYRKGFTTSNKTKLTACAKFKSLVENNKLKIYSKPLLSELKNFIASGTSYEAKLGEHDDLVMAMLLVVRMVLLVQTFDSDLDSELKDTIDDFIEPLPFIASFG